jgi:hypothetical protein
MAKKYYAQKDALGWPIPGTMMSGAKVPANLLEIPAANVAPGAGQLAVSHPEKLRYFVRKDKKGNIIPNTLIISLKKPEGDVYEFKLVKAS